MHSLLRMATSAASSASYFTVPSLAILVSIVSWAVRLANTFLRRSAVVERLRLRS